MTRKSDNNSVLLGQANPQRRTSEACRAKSVENLALAVGMRTSAKRTLLERAAAAWSMHAVRLQRQETRLAAQLAGPPSAANSVARYSMHLRDGTEKLMDTRPQEYLSAEALRAAVAAKARELLARDGGEGILDFRFRIDAEDEAGVVVYSLRLEAAATEGTDAFAGTKCAQA